MRAIILNVGNEVLSGRVLNTNTSFLSIELEKLGINVDKCVVVGDDENMLSAEIDSFMESDFDLLITTGGLGPTHDDFTKEVVCKKLGLELTLREEAYQNLVNYFGKEFAHSNIKLALFPSNAHLLANKCGTALGAILESKGKRVVLLVGPPFELQPMFINGVKPYLEKLMDHKILIHEFVVMGIGESDAEDYLEKFFSDYKDIYIAPYCSIGKVRYQFTALESQKDRFLASINEFRKIMKEYIITENNELIEERVVSLLKEKKYHISFAESCTGGMLASTIINVNGSSSVINESFVTYSNEAKEKLLSVNKNTISKFGVVSNETVLEMANGLYNITNSEVCVSVSGIAGPTGGSEEKPVGLVHFCIKLPYKTIIEHKIFRGERNQVRLKATMHILYVLYKNLNKN